MPDRNRVDDQSVLVDQAFADQPVDEGRAAVGDDHAARLALEPVDVASEHAAGDPALRPVGMGERPREDHLGMSFITSA